MTFLDRIMNLATPKLEVPGELRPTLPGRGWIISPFKNSWWTIPLAIFPAILGTILIFMDQQITAVIVNRKENKLKVGISGNGTFSIYLLFKKKTYYD